MANRGSTAGAFAGRLVAALFLLSPLFALAATAAPARAAGQQSVVYAPKDGPGKGKHIVFLSGDEEYRSEEGLPMLAKLLSQRHGFKCTVLFALDPDGTINPDNTDSLGDAQALDSADAIVMQLRFRNWPDEQMKHFVDAYHRGVPLIGLRTATHSFQFKQGSYKDYNNFGKRVLGEQWVSHWGNHKAEATLGVIEPSAKDDAVLRGVADVFGTTDVYEAYPPADAKVLLRGRVLNGMTPTSPPADYKKKRATDKQEQGVNDPMMAVAWSRVFKNEAGKENRILCTTMGAATDFENEGLRRLIVNGVYWGLGMDVPQKADVQIVGDYKPTAFGFKGYRKGVRPEDHALGAAAREGAAGATSAGSGTASGGNAASDQPAVPAGPLQLKKGDHIAILGGTLPDHFQHDGWLETLIHAHFPKDELVFRDLAASGDEVATWHRSENFGTRDQWLARTKADVIFAFYGFNESFNGQEGLPKFKADLDKFLKDTKKRKYSDKGPARVVLFSPVANEKLPDGNHFDPAANNANLQAYAAAMAEVAKTNGVVFVDLFAPSQDLYAQAARQGKPLTINGLYLSEEGDRQLAPVIFRGVFGETAPEGDFERLRAAVNEKNTQWHRRYRTMDGYNVYGGRSAEAYQPGKGGFITDRNPPAPYVSNYRIMQEEMTQRDVLTANRDPLVWSAAQGKDYRVDDSNLPPVEQVKTNHPGPNADGSWPFLSGEEAISKMKLPPNCKVNLFASEEQWPDLVNPVQMAWDTKGRLWVAVWRNYPERSPTSTVGDSILIFEDTDGDGKADRCEHYIDNLNCPTGFQFYKDGILLMQAPDLLWVHTGKDGKAGRVERVLMGMDSADSHHTTNSMCLEPGGATYLSDGVFHRTQVETAAGPVRNEDACIYRFEPSTGRFERYAAYGFANPHGRVFDYWGNDFITDATGNNTYFAPAFSGHLDYPAKHATLKQFWERPSRPCPGTNIMTSRHFPEEFWGNFLNCNVISFQGIYRVKVSEEGSGLTGDTIPQELVSSTDPTFRPTAVNVGPEGAVYFCDWSNAIIGHLQHHLRDPNRDHAHGRIYRMVYEGRPLEKPAKIDGQPVEALLELLKEPENDVRTRAKIELGKHDAAEVMPALNKWLKGLDKNDKEYQHQVAEALWVHQWHNVVDADLLKRVLRSPDPHARAAATRVLCYWRDRLPDALALLKVQADDEHPRVRLEAVRAASFFGGNDAPEAMRVAYQTLKQPTDYYLQYTLKETLRQLHNVVKEPVLPTDPKALAYVLDQMKDNELLVAAPVEPVLLARLGRKTIDVNQRLEAVKQLASMHKAGLQSEFVSVLRHLDSKGQSGSDAAADLAKVLPAVPADDLHKARADFLTLTDKAEQPGVRQLAWAAVAMGDQKPATTWAEAKTDAARVSLADALALLYNPNLREEFQPMLSGAATDPKTPPKVRAAALGALPLMGAGSNAKANFATIARFLKEGPDRAVAARAIMQLPRESWDKAAAGPVVESILAWAKTVPIDQRSEQPFVETLHAGTELAGLMPPADGSRLRKELRGLGVSVFVVRTVREQMRYDTPRLVVEAGKPFEVIFENGDFMPHNLLFVQPDSRQAVGEAAQNMRPDELDRRGRAYFPQNNWRIIDGTKLLEPNQKQTLKLVAPTKEGDYEYVCTFPGHWPAMWGRLIVTKDVDAYLQAHPTPDPIPTTAPGAEHDHAGQAK